MRIGDKFPGGMKALAEYIHSRGLKAGIYSDAGCNTCASVSRLDNYDPKGRGVGLYGHDRRDLHLMLDEWKYDFIKVDWCGGMRQRLSDRKRYTEISEIVRGISSDIVFNVCRWKFPGEWVTGVADSWRISGDIEPRFGPALWPGTILNIIEKNAGLVRFAGPGHYNDMDMLQVGRGMSEDEDKSHFSMWCMMASPLLAGNDLRDMSSRTVSILTQPDLIAINQDELGFQAERVEKKRGFQVWKKPLAGGRTAVAVLNTRKHSRSIGLELGRWYKTGAVKECWSGSQVSTDGRSSMEIAGHGILVFVD